MTKADGTELKNNIVVQKSIVTNRRLKATPTVMSRSFVSAESEVCYG